MLLNELSKRIIAGEVNTDGEILIDVEDNKLLFINK
jgi:hypothetical protein